ncbi:disease resistance protein RPV1-like [Lycium barbarum]|uniref:disease resistance protein RPV1-like n=1 Tax=Lycium barbarum TaxID=112863 RepID=UPI00293F0687|nr:disease resistance protein RPV1-like [Lycium barbarum]
MAGVGKTTIARALFNEISCQFEGSYFLANVRRVLRKHGLGEGLRYLRQKLLSHILKKCSVNVTNFNRAGEMINQMLCFRKVLVVVVDMDENDQVLEHLLYYAKGLPLALEVLGSFLYKQGLVEQRSALYRLKDFSDGKIFRLFSLSLDTLCDDYKNIFLHIACFFRAKEKKDVITILDGFGFKSKTGINVRKGPFLYISKGKIEMHDSIAQMGQQVARDAEQRKPWNCSRLWHEKDVKTVLSTNQITRTLTFLVAPQNESIKKWKYDAFLRFRGDDTHNNFVAHLYKCLEYIGINICKDDMKLEKGKFISTKLLKAIEKSRTTIIIFSEDYASSAWCLEELTMIMDCVDKKEKKAYPVFYNVEPSDIRMKGESGSFAKALEKHVEDYKASFEKLVTKHEADFKCGLQKVLANKPDRALRKKR